jgi:hypothetical protein
MGGTDFRPIVRSIRIKLPTADCRCGAAVRGVARVPEDHAIAKLDTST